MVTEVRQSGLLWFATVSGEKAAKSAAMYGVRLPWGTGRYSFTEDAWFFFRKELGIS